MWFLTLVYWQELLLLRHSTGVWKVFSEAQKSPMYVPGRVGQIQPRTGARMAARLLLGLRCMPAPKDLLCWCFVQPGVLC